MFKTISKFIASHSIGQIFNLGEKTAAWKKVTDLKPGMKIAIAENKNVEWDEIVSIKKVGRERVWDIEVEGTHNFVGNNIIAHNTSGILMRAGASTPTLSSSAASTTADIELAAADQMDLFAGRFSLTTSSLTAGVMNLTSTGTMTLTTSQTNANILLLPGTGNVGIGTTSPGGILDVVGDAAVSMRAGLGAFQFGGGVDDLWLSAEDEIRLYAHDYTLTLSGGTFTQTIAGDISTRITGDNDWILRVGDGAAEDTSNGNDIFMAAEDSFYLKASKLTLETSSSTNGEMLLRSDGSMTFDTSGGTGKFAFVGGNVGIGTTSPLGILDVVGDYGITMRAGLGATQFTGGVDDLWLSAEDEIRLYAHDYTLTLSGGTFSQTIAGDISNRITGDNDYILRVGDGAAEDTSNGNDIFISAEDSGILKFGDFTLSTSEDSVGSLTLGADRGGITLSTGWASSNGVMYLKSAGTLQLDTSAKNANILLMPGTGNVGIGTTGPGYTLQVDHGDVATGGIRVRPNSSQNSVPNPGSIAAANVWNSRGINLTNDGVLTTAAQTFGLAITSNRAGSVLTVKNAGGNAAIFESGNVGIGTTAPLSILDVLGTSTGILLRAGQSTPTLSSGILSTSADLELAAADQMDLFASRFSLSTSGAGNGIMNLTSTGTMTLTTSQTNAPMNLWAGSGGINLSSGTTTISGNVNLNSGTLALNGLTYTFPGTHVSNGILTNNGSGVLSWGTIGSSSITADSLDFSEFKDEMTLDADTSVNGDYSLIVRAGLGAAQNGTSGSNDLWLAAEDRVDVRASSLTISTSSASAGDLRVTSSGSLQLDTSANNANILLLPGTGNVGIGTTTPPAILSINASAATATDGLYITRGGTGSWLKLLPKAANNNYNAMVKLDDTAIIYSGGSIDTGGFVIAPWSNTSAGIRMNAVGNVGIGTTAPLGILHVVGDSSILLRAGTGSISVSGSSGAGADDLELAAEDQMDLFAGRFSLTTSSLTNGSIQLVTKGSLILDASSGAGGVVVNPGSGKFTVTGSSMFTKLGEGTGTTLVADTNGNIIRNTSSERYKHDITDLDFDTGAIFDLDPKSFTWNSQDIRDFGLIAEEVAQTLPQLVLYDNEGRPEAVKYSQLSVLLLEETKKLKGAVEMSEQQTADLQRTVLDHQGQSSWEEELAAIDSKIFGAQSAYDAQQTTIESMQAQIDDLKKTINQLQTTDYRLPTTASDSATATESAVVSSLPAGKAGQSTVDSLESLKNRVSLLENLISMLTAGLPAELKGTDASASATPTNGLTLETSAGSNISLISQISPIYLTTSDGLAQILAPTTIGGSLTVGSLYFDDIDSSINSLSDTLKLQPNALATIEFMGGKAIMDKHGNLTVFGEIAATKVVAGQYAILGVSRTIGSGVIKAGMMNARLNAPTITPDSKVFITATSKTDGQPIIVTEKQEGIGFTVEFEQPINHDVTFDYWIVQQE